MQMRVGIVDDDAVVRVALSGGLPKVGGFTAIAFGDPFEALEEIPENPPDVVLMDIRMPGLSGIDCTRLLHRRLPQLPIVMLTAYGDRQSVFAALAAGARGFLTKPLGPTECAQALLETQAGGAPMQREASRWLVEAFRASTAAWDHVSECERAILLCLRQGLQVKEVADAMGLETNTVRTHLRRIYRKLQVHDRDEALARVFSAASQGG
jgi:DNA-binding NarL/FixJ family response regulator